MQLWEESQVENERLRDRLRTTHEDLTKCKDQLDNAFQVVNSPTYARDLQAINLNLLL